MKKNNEAKQLLVFGYGLPVILFFFAWQQYFKHHHEGFSIVLLSVGMFVLVLTVVKSPWLNVIFTYWMKAAKVVGTMLTAFILTVAYGLIFTPIALCLRLTGKDYMQRKWNKGSASYWSARLQDQDHKSQ